MDHFSSQPISINSVPCVQLGVGLCKELAAIVQRSSVSRPIIVTDEQLLNLGLLDDALSSLTRAGIDVCVFSDVQADPPEHNVSNARQAAQAHAADVVIGFGGGSPLDVAKLSAVLSHPCNSDLSLKNMYGVEQFSAPRLPLIQIPTTAGTGSEATAVAIITTGATTKAGVVSPILLADQIVLDPELTVGLPAAITAATGIDAMVHAIEAFTSKRLKNPVSDALAVSALNAMANNIETAVFDGKNIRARSAMLMAAMMAGQAFANAPVGGVHALAYPIGGIFHVPHGLSNSLVLPHVLRFNGPKADELYSQLASNIFNKGVESGGATLMADYFSDLAARFNLPTQLRDVGVAASDLSHLADEAMRQQRLLVNNPRLIERSDALQIYTQAH